MNWKMKITKQFVLQCLIVLVVINYMIVTIILKDFILFKYMRDIILILLFAISFRFEKKQSVNLIFLYVFLLFAAWGFSSSVTFTLGLTVLRKYAFPILLMVLICNSSIVKDEKRLMRFLLLFFTLLAVWGVFQAHILKDEFLKSLGYPVEYSYGYGRMMLYNSYYFGGFGIQRVVATLSNSNVCALILGTGLLMMLINYPDLKSVKYRNVYLCCILVGYLLTFSRSNFLAFAIVIIILAWPYIPYKKQILAVAAVAVIAVVIVGIAQGTDGLIYKLFVWVQKTLNFTEDSAAGRFSRWTTALNAVIRNPLGIGFGHVGSLADAANITEYYSCENSYLAIALDTGWGGLLCFVLFLLSTLKKLINAIKSCRKQGQKSAERLYVGVVAIVLYFMIVMFFSNHIYDMEAVTLIFLYIGIATKRASEAKHRGTINE